MWILLRLNPTKNLTELLKLDYSGQDVKYYEVAVDCDVAPERSLANKTRSLDESK